jgi:hypothetical protein
LYQLEVKAILAASLYPSSEGWSVTIDIDAMERARGGSHPPDKLSRVEAAEARLNEVGATLAAHPKFGRADVVAEHPDLGTVVVEVEGDSSRQREQAMYSALGQLLLLMQDFEASTSYAIAVPDSVDWERQLAKVPVAVTKRLPLRLYLVSEHGVRDVTRREA